MARLSRCRGSSPRRCVISTDRFSYQQDTTRKALRDLRGLVLNVGANEDPAKLKQIDPARVINCDLFDHDAVLDRPNLVDVTFDCARDVWPYEDSSVALVVFGDILEHLTEWEMRCALTEARRVSQRLCVTVPKDTRPDNNNERADLYPRGAVHRLVVTSGMLHAAIRGTGWKITDWRALGPGIWWADYFFVSAE